MINFYLVFKNIKKTSRGAKTSSIQKLFHFQKCSEFLFFQGAIDYKSSKILYRISTLNVVGHF